MAILFDSGVVSPNRRNFRTVSNCLELFELVEEPVTRTPPHLEPIVPNSGNRLRTKSFTSLYAISTARILRFRNPINAHGLRPVQLVKARRQRFHLRGSLAESHAILFSFVSVSR